MKCLPSTVGHKLLVDVGSKVCFFDIPTSDLERIPIPHKGLKVQP